MLRGFTPAELRVIGKAQSILASAIKAETSIFNSPQVVKDWARLHCAQDNAEGHEAFTVVYLNSQHGLIEAVRHFTGTLTQTSVYPREIVKRALMLNAAAVVLMHNHPSGTPEPSRADEILTQTLKSGMKRVEVNGLDHFIGGDGTVTSIAEKGLI